MFGPKMLTPAGTLTHYLVVPEDVQISLQRLLGHLMQQRRSRQQQRNRLHNRQRIAQRNAR